jgi:hypothetical protein
MPRHRVILMLAGVEASAIVLRLEVSQACSVSQVAKLT